MLGLIGTWWKQHQIRNLMFRIFSGSSRRSQRKSLLSKARYGFRGFTVASFFASAILATAFSPPVFFSSVIIYGVVICNWLASGEFDAVGHVGITVPNSLNRTNDKSVEYMGRRRLCSYSLPLFKDRLIAGCAAKS